MASNQSRSLVYNASTNGDRTITQQAIPSICPPRSSGIAQLSQETLNALNIIETNYTSHLANKSYSDISNSYITYSNLFSMISKLQLTTTDPTLSVLLQITTDGLTGAMNTIGLSTSIIEANVKNILLQNQINAFESTYNQKNVISNTSGEYQITKTFNLAPIYSYYILLYGIPFANQGFDPNKIATLEPILINLGITPY
jgi:hypothetical protein